MSLNTGIYCNSRTKAAQSGVLNSSVSFRNDKNNGFLDQMMVPAEADLRESLTTKKENPAAETIKKCHDEISELLKANEKFFKSVGVFINGQAMKRFGIL